MRDLSREQKSIVGHRVTTAERYCLSLLALAVLAPLVANAQIKDAKNVLMVEDQMSAPAIEAVARVLEADLTKKSADPVNFFRESLDTFLIPEGDYQLAVRKWYEKKYSQRKLDLIVTVGPASHDFVRKEHSQYFPGVPVVFLLDIKPEGEPPAPNANFTGVWMDFDPVATIDVARRLLPATKHVVVVAGSGMFDQLFTKLVKTKLQGYQGVDFDYLTEFDIASLLGRVGKLSSDTIVLYLTVTKDRDERHMFVAYTLPLVSSASDVPVFGLMDLVLGKEIGAGRGIVGGRVSDLADSGPVAAELASRVLRGEKPESIPEVTVANRYVFDWMLLQKWGLDASRLPPGSTILNRDPGVWQRYKQMILGALALIVFLAGVVVYLLVERAKRVRAQQALEATVIEKETAAAELMELSGRLISAQEEERSRIARELHDDFSQRLAVLAINLKRAIATMGSDPQRAAEQVSVLCEHTSDIGGDLHKMSRNLHSSTLDVLGVVEGIRSLCKDFTEQQGLPVEFVSEGIPGSVPKSVSLCLFRIAQEALTNVKKHSGANAAVVELHGQDKGVVLSIADEGVGFDISEPTFKAGLGLQSMRERLRAVGGTVDVDSSKDFGTQIVAQVPLS
jgi:signal transduction histidine kinase